MIGVLIGIFFALMFLAMPIALALGVASLAYIIIQGYPLDVMIQRAFSMTQSFPLLAIPFFILLGELASYGGFLERIIRLAKALIGHLPGALGLIMVVGNMIFAGISGSAVADAAALGSMVVPAMKKEGYGAGFAGALNAAAGTLGVIIPPSIPMVVYGWITEVSVGQLFLGGAIPGIIIGVLMFIYVWVVARRRGYPRAERPARLSEILGVVKDSILAVIMPVLILVCIVSGVATPTEVSVVAVAYAFIVGMFVYHQLKWSQALQALKNTAVSTAVVMLIVCMSGLFSWLLSYERFGNAVAAFILSLSKSPSMVLTIIAFAMLIAGCFIDLVPNLLLFVPIFFPLVKSLGIDPVHFGVIMVVVLSIGLFTPPVGTTLFVSANISECSIEGLSKELIPYLLISFAVALITIYVPDSILWLPRLVFNQ